MTSTTTTPAPYSWVKLTWQILYDCRQNPDLELNEILGWGEPYLIAVSLDVDDDEIIDGEFPKWYFKKFVEDPEFPDEINYASSLYEMNIYITRAEYFRQFNNDPELKEITPDDPTPQNMKEDLKSYCCPCKGDSVRLTYSGKIYNPEIKNLLNPALLFGDGNPSSRLSFTLTSGRYSKGKFVKDIDDSQFNYPHVPFPFRQDEPEYFEDWLYLPVRIVSNSHRAGKKEIMPCAGYAGSTLLEIRFKDSDDKIINGEGYDIAMHVNVRYHTKELQWSVGVIIVRSTISEFLSSKESLAFAYFSGGDFAFRNRSVGCPNKTFRPQSFVGIPNDLRNQYFAEFYVTPNDLNNDEKPYVPPPTPPPSGPTNDIDGRSRMKIDEDDTQVFGKSLIIK